MLLNRRVRVEFDSVEERTHIIDRGYHYPSPHFVVKLRIYNRGLFRLKGEIVSRFGKRWTERDRSRHGCLIPREWSEPESIDLPGQLSRLRKIFRNSAKSESDEPEFFVYEIVRQEPARLLTLKIYSTFYKETFEVPKYSRRFRLTESARMNELEDQIAESEMKLEDHHDYWDTGNQYTPRVFEVEQIKYTREELEENFKNAFDG